jgi:hypothetical protein
MRVIGGWRPTLERRRDRFALLIIPLLVLCTSLVDEVLNRALIKDPVVRVGFGVVLAGTVLLFVLVLLRRDPERMRAQDAAGSGAAVAEAVGAIEGGAHGAGVLSDLARQCCEILDLDRAVVFGRDPARRGSMLAIVAHGFTDELHVTRFPLDRGVIRKVLATGSPVVVDDYSSIPGRVANSVTDDLRAVAAVPIRVAGKVRATLAVGTTASGRSFGSREVDLLERFASVGGVAWEHAEIRDRLEKALKGSVKALAVAVAARDNETGAHSEALVALAQGAGERLRLTPQELTELAAVARLHDVGKIAVPDRILRKPGGLDPDEREIMTRHTLWGEEILEQVPGLERIAKMVRSAHERWDGGGYPDGLSGDGIPLLSRVVFACDAYQAMTSDRPYRAALAPNVAVDELRAGAGGQFDPAVVDALLVTLDQGGDPSSAAAIELGERG